MESNRSTRNDVRLIGANGTARGEVSRADKFDFFRFSITNRSSYRVALTDLSSNADLTLLSGRRILANSNRSGRKNEAIAIVLNPGTYVLRVTARGGVTRYRLQVNTSNLPTPLPNPINVGSTEEFYSYEFGYERLPSNPSELLSLIPTVASFLGDEPDYFRALNFQYPSISVDLAASAMSLWSSREMSDFSLGRPDRLFVDSRGETVFIPGAPGLSGSQPFSPETIYFPLWFS